MGLCAVHNVTYIDVYSKMKGKPRLLADGLHPNAEGHETMLEVIQPLVWS